MIPQEIYVPVLTFIAGFIDAIAGGGGLITIPMWTLVFGPGALAVGTNKVGALLAASTALVVYARLHPLPWKKGLWFLIAISIGSFTGSHLTKLVSPTYFAWLMLALCPLILWIVWSRERLFAERPATPVATTRFVGTGLLVGLYDGFFGPGGGTFMLLALLWYTDMPLMSALALSKLANALSAALSLGGFAIQGMVDWKWGCIGGVAILLGSYLGAQLTKRKAVTVVKPALTIVVVLLMAKISWDLFR